MKKTVLVLAVMSLCMYLVTNADNISFPYTMGATDSLTAAKYNANNNAVKNVVNGKLTNANIKSTAAISQSKIDSASGWISNGTGGIKSVGSYREYHSPNGMKMFLNDTVSYDKEFVLYSDSTDSIFKMSNDSILLYKNTQLSGKLIMANGDSIIGSNTSIVANVISASTITGSGKVTGDSLIAAGARIANAATVGALSSSGAVSAAGRVSGSSGVFDSIQINGGAWVTRLDTGSFAMKITRKDTTQIVYNEDVSYQMLNNNVAISLPWAPTAEISSASFPDTFLVSALPPRLRPESSRNVYLPYVVNGGPGSVASGQLRYEIPATETKGQIVASFIPSGAVQIDVLNSNTDWSIGVVYPLN